MQKWKNDYPNGQNPALVPNMRKVFRHAWLRTFQTFGGWSAFLSLLAVPIVGFALHYLVRGVEPMNTELEIWLVYGLAAASLVFSTIFLWNLICAPYRLEKEEHAKTLRRLAEAEKQHVNPNSSDVPWYLRNFLTECQVRMFPSGGEYVQVLFPWDLRCTPTIKWGISPPISMDSIEIIDWDSKGLTLRLLGGTFSGRSFGDLFKILKSMKISFDAASEEELTTAALKLGFGLSGRDQVAEFIEDALRDPNKDTNSYKNWRA